MIYRNLFLFLVALFCTSSFTSEASGYSPAYAKMVSYKESSLSGNLTIEVWYHFRDSVQFGDSTSLSVEDPAMTLSQPASAPSSAPQTAFTPGDSVKKTYNLSYDTADLPFYPQEIEIKEEILPLDSAGVDSFGIEMVMAGGHIYFTPYLSAEIWNNRDFHELPRIWKKPEPGEPEPDRVYIPENEVPESDIPDTFKVDTPWKDNLQMVEKEGLAYYVEKMPVHPDTVAQYPNGPGDGPDSVAQSSNNTNGITTNSLLPEFSGTVSGQLIAATRNDLGDPVNLDLSGILVKLKEDDDLFNEQFETATTDENGNFTISYKEDQAFEGNGVELFLKIKSKNKNYEIKVKRGNIGASYNEIIDIGYTGDNTTVNLGTRDINDPEFRTLHWFQNAYRYVKNNGPTFGYSDGFNVLLNRNGSNFLADGMLGVSSPFLNPTIRLRDEDDEHENTVYHEFGHFYMWALQNKNYIAVYSDPDQDDHAWSRENTSRLAWSEGWANAMQMILDGVYWEEDNEYAYDEFGTLRTFMA